MRWNLEALGKVDSSELISSHLGEREIPTWLRDAIWERTGGNPFFIGEICRVLKRDLDSGVLVNRGQSHMPNDTLVALPLSAQAAILARMDLLPSGEHFLLKVASAVGTSFTAAGLAAVDLIQTAGVHVASALTNLVEAQLVVPDGSSGFAFSH